MPHQQQYSPGQLDAIARERGFPDYGTWMAWNQRRSESLQKPQNYGVQQPQQNNFLQSLLSRVWPSFGLISKVSDRYGEATGE